MESSMGRHRGTGFTLIELLMVTTIIATVAALALPGFQNAKKNANEGSCISSLRGLSVANEAYRTRFGSYPSDISDLSNAGMIDENLAQSGGAGKSGYQFVYARNGAEWNIRTKPVEPGISGDRYFYVDNSGVIRENFAGPAGSSDSAID